QYRHVVLSCPPLNTTIALPFFISILLTCCFKSGCCYTLYIVIYNKTLHFFKCKLNFLANKKSTPVIGVLNYLLPHFYKINLFDIICVELMMPGYLNKCMRLVVG